MEHLAKKLDDLNLRHEGELVEDLNKPLTVEVLPVQESKQVGVLRILCAAQIRLQRDHRR